MATLNDTVHITPDGDDVPSDAVLHDDSHYLSVNLNSENTDVQLVFSSRLAMYEFARALLHEAAYGENGQIELYPLSFEGKLLVVDGVRLSLDSSRVFINYPI
jgi:hypothetical protein